MGIGAKTHLETKIKVVFTSSRHDAVETVYGIRSSKLGLKQGINLLEVGQVGFAGNNLLGPLGSFGLDNISQDKLDVGSFWVGQ